MSNKIQIVNGDGKNLEISEVSEHLSSLRPNTDKNKNIIIPKAKKSNIEKRKVTRFKKI